MSDYFIVVLSIEKIKKIEEKDLIGIRITDKIRKHITYHWNDFCDDIACSFIQFFFKDFCKETEKNKKAEKEIEDVQPKI